MIYFFTGNSDYLVKEKTNYWKNAYIEKYGDFNFTYFKDLKNIDQNIISGEILSSGFMGEKKLIIILDIPLSSSIKDSDLFIKQDFIYSILDNIPEDNIVIFSSVNPDKRSKIYKKLKSISTKVEELNISGDPDLFSIISSKYNNKITPSAINLIIKYKSGNLDKIISEINKLLILNPKIDESSVKDNVFPELEESIFQLIDDLCNLRINYSIEKMKIILSQVSVYAFYNNLIANLRTIVYIKNLKNKNVASISSILNLGNKGFLLNKNYKISTNELNNFYFSLINLDKKMKSGSMILNDDDIFKYEIEKIILSIST